MNLTERVKAVSAADEAMYAALKRTIVELKELQRRLSETIDAKRLLERPNYPTEAQRAGITEAVRRFKDEETANTHHGDPCGPQDEPYAVVYAPQLNVGWMHIRDGAPFRFEADGSKLWTFTDAEVEQLLDFIYDQGVFPYEAWRSDGGLSVRIRTRNLDPKPWICTSCSDRFVREQKGLTTHQTKFQPRAQYDQDIEAYGPRRKPTGLRTPEEQRSRDRAWEGASDGGRLG